MNIFDNYIKKVYLIKKNKLIENFIFTNPGRDGDLGPRGLTGYRGYPGVRGHPGIQGEKGEPGDIKIPFQIVHRHIIYPIPLNKNALTVSTKPDIFYVGGGISESLENDRYMKFSQVKKDPKIIRRTRIYAIYSDNTNGRTSRNLRVEVGPCGPSLFNNNCKTYIYNLPLKGGNTEYKNTNKKVEHSYESYSNWVDDLMINDFKTAVRINVTNSKEGDISGNNSVSCKLFYMEFQVCDFYQADTPNL